MKRLTMHVLPTEVSPNITILNGKACVDEVEPLDDDLISTII